MKESMSEHPETPHPTSRDATSRDVSPAHKPDLNWFDKTIWAIPELGVGETKSNVYVTKIVFAGCLFLAILVLHTLFWQAFDIVAYPPPTAEWALALLYALCCVPVFLMTHSAEEVASADLSGWVRWMYTALGFLIFPVSIMVGGLLLAFLE